MMDIKKTACLTSVLLSAMFASQSFASGDDSSDMGRLEYEDKCVTCHGTKGKGDGVLAKILRTPPTDLTALSKKNGGVFPFGEVYGVIDGRKTVAGHGDREMPVWGRVYLREDARAKKFLSEGGYREVDMQLYARLRLLSLIDYLNRIQEK